MVQNVTSGTDPKILGIKCLDFGLTAILYRTYAVEPKLANTMQVADSDNYSATKWCFISSVLARCSPVYTVMQAVSPLLIVANDGFILNDPLTSLPELNRKKKYFTCSRKKPA